jgi:branched-chain amino acid transport system substrate-binding protein
VYTADGMRTDSFGQLVDPNNPGVVAGIKGTAPAAAPAGVQNPFLDKLAAAGVDPIFSAYYYDCTILTALAAEKAKSDDPVKMTRVFADNTRGKSKCNTFADCKTALDAKKSIQYQGASAVFPHMNDFGKFEPRAGAYEVWSFDTGARDVVDSAAPQIRIK